MRPILIVIIALTLITTSCSTPSGSVPTVTPAAEVSFRDLLPNARQPRDGVVSGGQPSLEQLHLAKEAGFATVINLRTEGEKGTKKDVIEGLGFAYHSLPISGSDLNETSARALWNLLEESEGPILLHCGSGNRVGALFALGAFYIEGQSAEEALAYGQATGLTRLEPRVREILELPVP